MTFDRYGVWFLITWTVWLVDGTSTSNFFEIDPSSRSHDPIQDSDDDLGVKINVLGREMDKACWRARIRLWNESARHEHRQKTQIGDLQRQLKSRDDEIRKMRKEMTEMKVKMQSMQQNHERWVQSLIDRNQNLIRTVEKAVSAAKQL